MTMYIQMDEALAAYKQQLEANYDAYLEATWPVAAAEDFEKRRAMYNITFEEGQKYIKVVMNHLGGRSVHSFVVAKEVTVKGKTFPVGTILKAASWKTPAFNFKRGDVFIGDYGRAATEWVGI